MGIESESLLCRIQSVQFKQNMPDSPVVWLQCVSDWGWK